MINLGSSLFLYLFLFLCVAARAAAAPALVIYAVDSLLGSPQYNYTQAFEISAGLPAGSVVVVPVSGGNIEAAIMQPGLNPPPDVVIGLDNIHQFELSASTFLPVTPPSLANISKALYGRMSPYHIFPYEYGRITVIANSTRIGKRYDPNALTLANMATNPDALRKFIVQNPVTDITGAAFLMGTIATFGDPAAGVVGVVTGQGDWRQWWKTVLTYAKVTPSWGDSWDLFYADNDFDLLVSYELDSVYYYCTANETDILALTLGGDLWYLLQGIGVHNQSTNQALALQFVDWFLSGDIQDVIPNHEWMWPAKNNVTLPQCFNGKYVSPDPTFNERLSTDTILQNINKWLADWNTIYQNVQATTTTTSSAASLIPFLAAVAIVCMILV